MTYNNMMMVLVGHSNWTDSVLLMHILEAELLENSLTWGSANPFYFSLDVWSCFVVTQWAWFPFEKNALLTVVLILTCVKVRAKNYIKQRITQLRKQHAKYLNKTWNNICFLFSQDVFWICDAFFSNPIWWDKEGQHMLEQEILLWSYIQSAPQNS